MEVTKAENNNEIFNGFMKGLLSMPGVKVDRDTFLKESLAKYTKSYDLIEKAIEVGTIEAGFSRMTIDLIANKVMKNNVFDSTKYSFFTGIPGGFAMAATIPADTAQFYAHVLILAQKLAYLYGYENLWRDELEYENAKNQMMLFLGVMFGVSGSTATLKVVTANLSNQALQKLPQKTLAKTIYYPIIKKIAKFLGISITKQSFAKGVSKVIPVVGGLVSGGITYASLKKMGEKLRVTLSESISEEYSESDYKKDIQLINEDSDECIDDSFDGALECSSEFGRSADKTSNKKDVTDVIEQIEKLNKLKESNAISDEEFEILKIRLIE